MIRIVGYSACVIGLVAGIDLAAVSAASARGGGSSIMNSPGYQRRLQESRGYVTNQSGSILPQQPPVTHHPKRRHRR